jgi:hypothetical protein
MPGFFYGLCVLLKQHSPFKSAPVPALHIAFQPKQARCSLPSRELYQTKLQKAVAFFACAQIFSIPLSYFFFSPTPNNKGTSRSNERQEVPGACK